MSRSRLILDTDGGVDDAQALIMLIANGRAPDLVTTVFGNVDLHTATRNILDVLKTFGTDIPVYAGAARPLTEARIDAREVHGEDGLGGAPRPASQTEPASRDGVGALRRAFREAAQAGERVDILMIGPLTNLALALRQEPEILSGIGRLTIMGGTIFGRGNVTPAAEFNIYADPEAAAIVFSESIETTVVAWEPCVAHFIAGADVEALIAAAQASPQREFSAALARHARHNIMSYGHPDRMFYVDPLAAAVAIDENIVRRTLRASVGVALAPGISRGMTVVDPSGRLGTPKVTFVEEADQTRLDEFYAASLRYRPGDL